MDKYEMAHRWCNCDFGKKGGYRSGNVSCDETYFYSYGTVYAMWLDKTPGKQLMVLMDYGCSNTSREHRWAIKQAIPEGVKCIETHINPYTYGHRASVEFNRNKWQVQLPFTILEHLKKAIEPFKDSKIVATRENLSEIQRMSDDINWLYDNRKDCKVKGTNERLKDKKLLKKIFIHVRKKCKPEELVDIVLDKGAYSAYEERLTPQKKAKKTRRFVKWFHRTHNCAKNTFTKKEIDKLPISEKVRLACLPETEQWELDNNNLSVALDRNKRLAIYLLGKCANASFDGKLHSNCIVNRFTGEKYDFIRRNGLMCKLQPDKYSFAWGLEFGKWCGELHIRASDYKKICNKEQWLKRFYQKAAIVSARRKELEKWMEMQSYTETQLSQCTEEELAQYNRIQMKFAQYMADKEAQRLAEEKERQQMEEKRKRLEEERKLKYDSYVARGIDGYRDLYYENLDTISVSHKFGNEFFFGGNVLLRWRTSKIIETSKNILITITQAKEFFKKISEWHEDPSKFSDYTFNTKSGNYNANGYKNDILTVGCHKIAYCEMERMYNDILKRETIKN